MRPARSIRFKPSPPLALASHPLSGRLCYFLSVDSGLGKAWEISTLVTVVCQAWGGERMARCPSILTCAETRFLSYESCIWCQPSQMMPITSADKRPKTAITGVTMPIVSGPASASAHRPTNPTNKAKRRKLRNYHTAKQPAVFLTRGPTSVIETGEISGQREGGGLAGRPLDRPTFQLRYPTTSAAGDITLEKCKF